MRLKTSLKSKVLHPCTKLFRIFRFKLKKPFFIRPRHIRPHYTKVQTVPKKNKMTALFQSAFRSLRKPKGMDRLAAIKSFSEKGDHRVLPPSPVTPAYVKAMAEKTVNSDHEEVQDACRSFENYLVEMIVEEGKVRDLTDVEELLYCWKNLKCPVFIDLVSRFYGELCKDLFSPDTDGSSSS
ncbi:transcription repressor OFP17-like [Rosa rugosa]|uniref:transcription repressor OFP17-like n=1 Tax=Rosa rugosa TaxID=74645 RepID=UPI002B408B5D|nr:transcription repressor OFP17-like [Rosa rugosa]